MSDAACFSFYANKIITTGEGGMVLVMIRQLQIGLLFLLGSRIFIKE
jgi:DegT/DnrJ/EryC1/StrS aminotransferase family